MKLPNQPTGTATTQTFTEIVDIVDNIVLLKGGNACLVIEITASNFALLSEQEQRARLLSYAGLLNSLTFPIQILIRNKRVDVSSYIKNLQEAESKTTNPLLAKQIHLYKEFVGEMVRVNVVLNKTFYVVISFSALEAGFGGAKQVVTMGEADKQAFIQAAKKALQSKSESLHPQIAKLAIASKTLGKEDLVRLFYDIYNEGSLDTLQAISDSSNAFIKQGGSPT